MLRSRFAGRGLLLPQCSQWSLSRSNLRQPARNYSTEAEAFISTSTDPYFNLALEDHLFRTRSPKPRPSGKKTAAAASGSSDAPAETQSAPLLLLYRNQPCVVIGRNQNSWKEIDSIAMNKIGLPLVRRRSGGGTVYHDLGNTNYSIHMSREQFDRSTQAQLIARALNGPPIDLASPSAVLGDGAAPATAKQGGVYVNERSDICIQLAEEGPGTQERSKATERKVSGSAYKLTGTRAYHHGTMLLSSNLTWLGTALRNSRGDALETKGIASVRAPVLNLVEAFPARGEALSHDAFCQAAVREFYRVYGYSAGLGRDLPGEAELVGEEMMEKEPKLRVNYEELTSWDWVYGQTPEFTHRLVHNNSSGSGFRFGLCLHARHGVIEEATVSDLRTVDDHDGEPGTFTQGFEETLHSLVTEMKGQRYDHYATRAPGQVVGGTDSLDESPENVAKLKLLQWLKSSM